MPHKHCPSCGDELEGAGPICTSCKVKEWDETAEAAAELHEPEPAEDHEPEHAPEPAEA